MVVLIDTGFRPSRRVQLQRRVIRAKALWPGNGLSPRLRRGKNYVFHAREAVAGRAGRTRRVLAAGSEEQLDERLTLRRVDKVARRAYRLQPYDGTVLYVRASDLALEGDVADTRDAQDVLRRYVTGPYSVATVPGTHASLIDPGYVDNVADAIADALDVADGVPSDL